MYKISKETKEWIENLFKDEWKDIETDIDFSKHKPISSTYGTHILEEVYNIDGERYRLLFQMGNYDNPIVQILITKK